jgi:dihydroorotate dehydrogenase
MYNLLKKILFQLDPETAHAVTLNALQLIHALGLTSFFRKKKSSPFKIMGITFPNQIGLAAGLDKNGDYIDALSSLGFGFIEVGTVTPKSQSGNLAPRLFRLVEQEAIINRMGFNNKGCDYLAERLKKTKFKGVLGINIGKNRDTAIENAVVDYVYGFRALASYASYITINISSPNTASLRDLQQTDLLYALLEEMKNTQTAFHAVNKKYVPLVVKLAPDLNADEVRAAAEILLATKIDGVIATNTTVSRIGVENSFYVNEVGGLSGKPLRVASTAVIQQLYKVLGNKIPIIASGGVMSAADASEKIAAGASLVQLYTGLIYCGPRLIGDCLKY